jgi:hypothetical protein
MLRSAEKMNIRYVATRFAEGHVSSSLLRHFYETSANLLNWIFKPQFNLSITHHVTVMPKGYNVTYLNMPTSNLYQANGKFRSEYNHLTKYDAYADLYTLVNGNNPVLDDAIKAHNLKDKKIIPIYFAQDYIPYKEVQFEKALLTGSLWGCARGSLRLARAMKKLGDENLLAAYGLEHYLSFLGDAYKGAFEKQTSDLLGYMEEKHREYGISLVIHSLEHMLEGLPTNRIVEAISTGTIAISDKNPFIEKYFGDNVLYFNTFGNEQEIYKEIKEHIIWVKNNRELAIQKAKKAHEIFTQNFTMENQLNYLINFLEGYTKVEF